ncbi:hypothetical protein [Spartinivicinus poritis]|uniref:Uncharacterized protein n=1 Tax=Spartinivicinus poritis TaxID=2994640 RepID=A0ABT5UE18_9GAMM|nr:hypothetical protein [Spartinivicinus sp. A2-2]MDE1464620.1 hypothetical protein [Spartinivicinus sp. A2-2]
MRENTDNIFGTRQQQTGAEALNLSPMPLFTGQRPSDWLRLIWQKNSTHLDIGTGSPLMAMEMAIFLQSTAFITYICIFLFFLG